MVEYGPTLPISEEIHQLKYRSTGETFKEAMTRVADSLKDNEEHFKEFRNILYEMRFLPAGRVQSAMGSPMPVTPYNCFVSRTIPDSMEGIMAAVTEAAETMRLGGGIGYDFSTLRPRGAHIKRVNSPSSGPISFMGIFDALCKTISSAGHRRGAQMGVLRVDHPDIEEFIRVKNNSTTLTQFNISVGITDKFMEAVEANDTFDLVFEDRVYKTINARALWDDILRSTWDWAEPGVLFIDKINRKNNLWYLENIAATNPCAEQPLPPYGACLLGSFTLVKYLIKVGDNYFFDFDTFKTDIPVVVRAMDNVVDRAVYPLPQQREEAFSKRRMGLGVTGLANAVEACGFPYNSAGAESLITNIMVCLRDTCYRSSIYLALEKGPFPLYDEKFLESGFAKTLPDDIRAMIKSCGIRNSHLLSIAPTGTISLSADNVSSGIEPVFSHFYERTIQTFDGPRKEIVEDYGYRTFGIKGITADQLSVDDHVRILNLISYYVDSACSKTCNVGSSVTWQQFKDVYTTAFKGNASGCTTFRAAGKRYGILNANASEDVAEPASVKVDDFVNEVDGAACYFDPETGQKSCS
jgi:ribonucleoside-diphosphate reductase alpha chain